MTQPHVLVADWLMPDFELEQELLEKAQVTWSLPQWRPPQPPRDEQRRQLVDRIQNAERIDAVLFQLAPLDRDVIDLLPDDCRLLQRIGIGLDTVDLERASQRDIAVLNTPDYCVEEVAVHAMSVLLSLHRQLNSTQQRLLAGQWSDRPPRTIERLSTLTLGLLGLGRIGRKLGEWMRPLVKQVIFFDPHVTQLPPWAEAVTLDELFKQSDLLSLHCPLVPETRHVIGEQSLRQMKPTALLANAARGGLVDAQALAAALAEDRLAGAGLDVFEPEVLADDSPLRSVKNVILTSHTAWHSRQSGIDARTTGIQNILSAVTQNS